MDATLSTCCTIILSLIEITVTVTEDMDTEVEDITDAGEVVPAISNEDGRGRSGYLENGFIVMISFYRQVLVTTNIWQIPAELSGDWPIVNYELVFDE